MIDNKKLLATVTAVALIGVFALFVYSASIQPLSLDIGEIGTSHVGTMVRTSGTVIDARTLSGGSVAMELADFNASASISVFLSSTTGGSWDGDALIPGAVVEVMGEVRLYQEMLELSVSGPENLRIISASNTTEYALGTVMRSVEMFDGLEITTSGHITDIGVMQSNSTLVGTSFSVCLEEGNQSYCLECFCPDRDLSTLHQDWDAVRVTGVISYYENRGCWQMTVEVVSPA